jgi:hypothetical protein
MLAVRTAYAVQPVFQGNAGAYGHGRRVHHTGVSVCPGTPPCFDLLVTGGYGAGAGHPDS